jgi:hypothetical protein
VQIPDPEVRAEPVQVNRELAGRVRAIDQDRNALPPALRRDVLDREHQPAA